MIQKQLALHYFKGLDNYDEYKRLAAQSPNWYPNDFSFYMDTTLQRHNRTRSEIKKLQQLLETHKISPSSLLLNTWNSFYPSYILHHHHTVFSKIYRASTLGAYFKDMLKTTDHIPTLSASTLPTIHDNIIHMDPNHFFYSPLTSPYLTHCCFRALSNNTEVICVVSLSQQHTIRDFGSIMSPEYMLVGYNFNNTKCQAILDLVPNVEETMDATDVYLSLKDLHKALHITISYTSMRRQFKTLDNTPQERLIISYQAVAARIIHAFGLFVALSQFYTQAQPKYIKPSLHQIILKQLIHLRECCGGFGYLQTSGHPGCLERVTFRAAMAKNIHPNIDNKDTMSHIDLQKIHPYSQPKEMKAHYEKLYNRETPTHFVDIFCVFNSLCSEDRSLALQEAAIQYMYNIEQFSRFDKNNIHKKLLEYMMVKYIWENGQRIKIVADKKVYLQVLRAHRDQLLVELSKEIKSLGESLEIGYLRNVVIGRENSEQFYQEVVKTSKESKRNSKEFSQYVKAPVVEMIKMYRAKL